jgi:hypothetical protein
MGKLIACYEMLPDGSWRGTIPEAQECVGGEALSKTLDGAREQLQAVAKKLFGDDVTLVDRVL